MQLLQDIFIIEQLQVLSEGKADGPMKIRGVFGRCNEKNNNGRIYPTAVLESQLSKVQPLINERRLCGELDHPQNDTVKLSNASHLITKLDMKGNELIGEAEILKTPAGLTAKALVEGGVKIGISSRGMGTLSEDQNGDKIVNEDFRLVTFDLVADPSTRGAFPGLSESTESKFVKDSQSKLQKESNFVTMLESKMRDAYDPWIEEAKKKNKKPLTPAQRKHIDKNKNNKIDGEDFDMLRNEAMDIVRQDGHWHRMAYALAEALGHEIREGAKAGYPEMGIKGGTPEAAEEAKKRKKKVNESFDDLEGEKKKDKLARRADRAQIRSARGQRLATYRDRKRETRAAAKEKARQEAAERKKKGVLSGAKPEQRQGKTPDTGHRTRSEDKRGRKKKRGPERRGQRGDSPTGRERRRSGGDQRLAAHTEYKKIGQLMAEAFDDTEALRKGDLLQRSRQIQRGAGTPAAGFMARRRMIATGKAQGKADVAAEKARMQGQARLDRERDRIGAARAAGKPIRVGMPRRVLGGVKDFATGVSGPLKPMSQSPILKKLKGGSTPSTAPQKPQQKKKPGMSPEDAHQAKVLGRKELDQGTKDVAAQAKAQAGDKFGAGVGRADKDQMRKSIARQNKKRAQKGLPPLKMTDQQALDLSHVMYRQIGNMIAEMFYLRESHPASAQSRMKQELGDEAYKKLSSRPNDPSPVEAAKQRKLKSGEYGRTGRGGGARKKTADVTQDETDDKREHGSIRA